MGAKQQRKRSKKPKKLAHDTILESKQKEKKMAKEKCVSSILQNRDPS